jgi:hypothetical protein
MLVSAPLAYQLAPVLCRGSHISESDCSWYHSIWQYLRIFNLVSTPTWHSEFYLREIGAALGKTITPNVLISGTADYSMLAHVLWGLGQRADAKITVADLCETPLLLCKWYARFAQRSIRTENTDIMKIKGDAFDLIVSDAFLTRFSPQARTAMIQKWGYLLKPGGSVITTVRIEPRSSDDPVGSTLAQIENFASRAKIEARKWQTFLDLSPDQITSGAKTYAERMVSYSCRSVAELEQQFRSAGLRISTTLAQVPGEMKGTDYARVVATKVPQ